MYFIEYLVTVTSKDLSGHCWKKRRSRRVKMKPPSENHLHSFILQGIEPGLEKKIKIDDTTLRDGEQTAGVVFANQEKVRIARLLDEVGCTRSKLAFPPCWAMRKRPSSISSALI